MLAASGKPYIVEVERRTAVNRALDMLRPGDVLALCGKGHEDYQVIDGVTPFIWTNTGSSASGWSAKG